MGQFRKRSTQEFEIGHPRPLRHLLPMLVGVAVAGGAYWALGLKTRTAQAMPELVLRVDGDLLHLPDGTNCALPNGGCSVQLSSLPLAELRAVAPPRSLFAATTPILRAAADRNAPALLDDEGGPVEVVPKRPTDLKTWSTLDPDAPGLRLRIILRSDGFWLAGVGGKVLGADSHGPTLVPLSSGQDFPGLEKKLAAIRAEFRDTEDTCALLPSLDMTLAEVVKTAEVAHRSFPTVLIAVP